MKLDKEKYLQIRMAQSNGARTIDELKEMTDIVIENDEELELIDAVLKNACKCKKVSIEDVLNAVNNGASTVKEVMAATKAGSSCGKCKRGVLTNIIENKR